MNYFDWVYIVYGVIAFGCLIYGLHRAGLVEKEDRRIWEGKQYIKRQKENLNNDEKRLRTREKELEEKIKLIKDENRKLDQKRKEFVIYD